MSEVHVDPEIPGAEETPKSNNDFAYHRRAAMSHPGVRIGLIFAVLVLVVAGVFLWRYLMSYESTDDAQIDGHISSISARVSGHIIKVNIEDNQKVQAGDVLVEIDPTDYQVAVDKARADYADAVAAARGAGTNIPIMNVTTSSQVSVTEANIASTQAGIAASRQQLEAAKAQLAQAEANDAKAQSDLVRYKQLVDKQEISAQQYDQAVASAKASTAGVAASRAAVDTASAQIAQAQAREQQARADWRSAKTAPEQVSVMRSRADSARAMADRKKADLDQAELNLRYAKIIAPTSGVISGRTVELGQNVMAGQELMKVVPLDDVWVTANFKETQLRMMRPGQPVSVMIDANGKMYRGHVDSIAGASGAKFSLLPPENATGNYVKVVQRIPVKITLDPEDLKTHELRPGMSANPKVWIRK